MSSVQGQSGPPAVRPTRMYAALLAASIGAGNVIGRTDGSAEVACFVLVLASVAAATFGLTGARLRQRHPIIQNSVYFAYLLCIGLSSTGDLVAPLAVAVARLVAISFSIAEYHARFPCDTTDAAIGALIGSLAVGEEASLSAAIVGAIGSVCLAYLSYKLECADRADAGASMQDCALAATLLLLLADASRYPTGFVGLPFALAACLAGLWFAARSRRREPAGHAKAHELTTVSVLLVTLTSVVSMFMRAAWAPDAASDVVCRCGYSLAASLVSVAIGSVSCHRAHETSVLSASVPRAIVRSLLLTGCLFLAVVTRDSFGGYLYLAAVVPSSAFA